MIARLVSACDICCNRITPGNHVQKHDIHGWVHSDCNRSALRRERRRKDAIKAKKQIMQLSLFK